MHIQIEDERGIDGFFDEISYNKGASIIRMLVVFLQRDLFAVATFLISFSQGGLYWAGDIQEGAELVPESPQIP